jgi:type III secretory pathway component EscS
VTVVVVTVFLFVSVWPVVVVTIVAFVSVLQEVHTIQPSVWYLLIFSLDATLMKKTHWYFSLILDPFRSVCELETM